MTYGSINLVLACANKATTVCSLLWCSKNRAEIERLFFFTLGRSTILTCLRHWHPYRGKCLFMSQTSGPWAEGLADCSVKEATLLLIEDEEELVNCSIEHNTFIKLC